MSDNSTRTPSFSKLNDVNYPEWAMRMEAHLIRLKLWDGIVEITVDEKGRGTEAAEEEEAKKKEKRSAQKMAEARAELITYVEDGQLSHMRSRDPMEIWQNLADVHKARGLATQLAMKRRFLTAKKKKDQMVQAWIGQIRSMAFRMEETGLTVSNQDIILALTLGLPPSFDQVIVALDSTPTKDLALDVVITRLLNDEVRQTSTSQPTPSITRDAGQAAAAISSEKPKTPIDRTKVMCFFCDKAGHYKSECPEKAAWEAAKVQASANTAVSENLPEMLNEVSGAW